MSKSSVEMVAESVSENGTHNNSTESAESTSKRVYNRKPRLDFTDVEVQALHRILGKRPIHDAWREQLCVKVAEYLGTQIDFEQPPSN